MSYEIRLTDAEGDAQSFFLGTTTDYDGFLRWADGLPDETYPELINLVNFGWVDGTDCLAEQIAHALKHEAPKEKGVAETSRHILGLIGVGHEHERAEITDGVNDDEDGEDSEGR